MSANIERFALDAGALKSSEVVLENNKNYDATLNIRTMHTYLRRDRFRRALRCNENSSIKIHNGAVKYSTRKTFEKTLALESRIYELSSFEVIIFP